MRSQASARLNSQYGFWSRVSFGVAASTWTCTRAGTAFPPVRDTARRISVRVSKSIVLVYHESQVVLNSALCTLVSAEGAVSFQPGVSAPGIQLALVTSAESANHA